MKKLVVIGNLGYFNNSLNGQSIRTRSVFQMLEEHSKEKEFLIRNIDTSELKKPLMNRLKFIINTIIVVLESNIIVIMPAQRALKFFFPIFNYVKLVTRKKVHYVVIGGWLPVILDVKPKYKKYLRKFDSIHVQTNGMVNELNLHGIHNVYYLSNFRYYAMYDDIFSRTQKYSSKVVYYSRILKQKGVEDLIVTINKINSGLYQGEITLDMFGPIEDDYRSEFLSLIEGNSNINYLGVLYPDKLLSVLSRYQFLILPTYYKTEGFPGAILDAMSAGLPIVTTKWNYSDEFIIEGYNGFTFNSGDTSQLIDLILELINDVDLLKNMSDNSYQMSKNFHPELVSKNLISAVFE